jgi:hypothetical protein
MDSYHKLIPARAVEIRWIARLIPGVKRKSFPASAKPTRPVGPNVHSGKALAMAQQMLLGEADEVARNGAFGKHFGQR